MPYTQGEFGGRFAWSGHGKWI